MSEEQRVKVLQVPKSIHPILGIHDHVSEEPDPPFFLVLHQEKTLSDLLFVLIAIKMLVTHT